MMLPRTFRVDYDHVTSVVCVVGAGLNVNLNRSAPPGSEFFSVKSTATVQYSISPRPQETSHLSPTPLKGNSALLIRMSRASDYENDGKLSIRYYGEKKDVLGRALLHLTAVEISLDVDADRDGVVEKNNANKGSWKWGSNGHGAILLVNCDSERMFLKKLDSEQDQVSKVSDLKDMSVMVLRTKGPAKLPEGYKLTMHISQGDAESEYPLVLSNEVLSQEVPYLGGVSEMKFYVEGLRFPDKDFDGLISINLSLLEPISDGLPETPIFTDTAVFRVAPWIMTPNTLQPVEVTSDNYQFLKGMRNLVTKSGYKLKICHEYMNRGDRWMQGPDFGYVTRLAQREDVSSLDSFGNLEVSPPVTVNGKNYPLGRILIGVAFPTATKGRNMTKVVQDFLWAQKGFRLLLASPDAGYKLFRGLQRDGHGQAKLFEGRPSCIDWNRDVLKRELGLDDEDIIDLPILFKLVMEENDNNKAETELRAVAYYPDMVNGRCALEVEMCSLMEGLGLSCTFIDDFASYHKQLGEVHCGSNVRREPFDFKWWNLEM
ncbi:hypothetical protein F7725_017415 [Dissostichus mawsoni]|uniref:Protein-arginine deiminase n=1 Tax=Dissostichus mawsoni TaxID=36200 RepID=A0A7J5Z4C9_DISMA|nr:hypothetical protein F7725_017415 [Dissostichus mawsoni]